ncbi:MAG: helix-turn-helix domain-containing protein [Acidobacteriota bacterium]
MDISEVARRSAQPPSTLRYYEELGLIESVGRKGLKRLYEDSVLDRLALIALGRAAGFSLTEIGEMFTGSRGVNIDRSKLLEKASELDRIIERLIVIRDGLQHTADCPSPSLLECPNFRGVMRTAGRGLCQPLETVPSRRGGASSA